MGILNITPDSFSDGGRYYRNGKPNLDLVLKQASEMSIEGVDIFDIGGESTRPGAVQISVNEELDRTIPVVELLAKNFTHLVSIDTSSPEVMQEALVAGAGMINDVRALQRKNALNIAAKARVPVILVHMKGQPEYMHKAPVYEDIITEVRDFLQLHRQKAIAAGIHHEQIILDPGFGFGKSLKHNLTLLKNLSCLCELDSPILVGISRKSMLGKITGKPVESSMPASISAALLAVQQGANILRVHDVGATHDMLNIWESVSIPNGNQSAY